MVKYGVALRSVKASVTGSGKCFGRGIELELGHSMAYRGEQSEILSVVGAVAVAETPAVVAKPAVSARDRRMVRIALGMIVALAAANMVLYLPRAF